MLASISSTCYSICALQHQPAEQMSFKNGFVTIEQELVEYYDMKQS